MPPAIDIDQFNVRFAIPGVAEILPGNGDLPKIHITTPAASAEIYLHGAQITSWKPTSSEEVLLLSRQSVFQDGKAIRGGIPICFPWFRNLSRAKSDNPKAPAHGTVRTKAWALDSITEAPDGIIVTLTTVSDKQSRQWFPHDFHITHRITVGLELKLELIVRNTGVTPFQFEEALHTYHRVGDVQSIHISGLDGVSYLDNQDENREKVQEGAVQLTQPTDNAYLNTAHPVEIADPTLGRRIRIEKQNSQTTIVWTPWEQGAAATADLGDEEWLEFACVEAGNILSAAIHLAPGQQHTLTANIGVAPEPA